MKKLILRLMAVILSVYVAGSVYPLFATVGGHGPAPAPAPAPSPPPAPAPPAPSAPPMLDTKGGPPLAPPAPRESGGGGCGPEVEGPLVRTYGEARQEQESWRHTNFDAMASEMIENVRGNAAAAMDNINRDIKRAQDRFHRAHMEVDKYQDMKNRGTLMEEDFLKDAQQELKEAWAELQRQKGRIQKVEAWADKKVGEIRALANRAKGGDYNGYRGLQNFDWSYNPSWFK